MVVDVRPDAGYEGQQVLLEEFWLFMCLSLPSSCSPQKVTLMTTVSTLARVLGFVKGYWLEQRDKYMYFVEDSRTATVEVQSFYEGGSRVQLKGHAVDLSQSQPADVRLSDRLAKKLRANSPAASGLLTLPLWEAERLSRAALHGHFERGQAIPCTYM